MNGRSEIKITKGTINGDRYVSALENEIYSLSFQFGGPSSDWLLMDDNATSHRCRKVKEYKELSGIRTLDWPPRSPDLNPFENVLKILIRRKIQSGSTLSNLEKYIKISWNEIPQSTINKCISSMTDRVHKVLMKKGDII